MGCKHERYKQGRHLTADNALKAIKAGKYCWMGKVITHCQDCGSDISYANVVEVKTHEQYLKTIGVR